MNRFILVIMFVSFAIMSYSQKTVKVSATYTYYAPETMSVEEAKRVALDRAKIQAIADEFGTIVSQSTSTVITNKNGETDTQFFALGGSDVKGEWIETIKAPVYAINYESDMLIVNVTVSGKIREYPKSRIPILTKVLRNGTTSQFEDDTFKNGDELFLLFQSPVEGYLLVYLLDYSSDKAYCLLPYSASSDASQHIEQDREYVFFSEKHAAENLKPIVDQYTLECGTAWGIDHNDIIIVFSPNQLIKSNSIASSNNTPRQLKLEEFEKWRADLLKQSTENQIITKSISIKK